jgi:hypothetical protein
MSQRAADCGKTCDLPTGWVKPKQPGKLEQDKRKGDDSKKQSRASQAAEVAGRDDRLFAWTAEHGGGLKSNSCLAGTSTKVSVHDSENFSQSQEVLKSLRSACRFC